MRVTVYGGRSSNASLESWMVQVLGERNFWIAVHCRGRKEGEIPK